MQAGAVAHANMYLLPEVVIVHIDCSTLLCVASGGSASGERTINRSQHLVKIRHESVYLVTYGDRPKSCDAAALDGTTHGTATPHTRRPHGSTTSRIRPRLACLLLQMHTSGSIARCMLWSWLLAPHVTSRLLSAVCCNAARRPSDVRSMRGHALSEARTARDNAVFSQTVELSTSTIRAKHPGG